MHGPVALEIRIGSSLARMTTEYSTVVQNHATDLSSVESGAYVDTIFPIR
jgi:hypothetical protein